jgi:hypothetical protein
MVSRRTGQYKKTLNRFSWFTLTSGFAFLLSQITAEIVIYTKE